MIPPPLTFRQWSITVECRNGAAILRACREVRRAAKAMQGQMARDLALHGQSITRVDMGEGCTPIIRRIDPNDFYVEPEPLGA